MVKTHQNLQLLARDVVHELSILESRKHNQAVVCSNSGGLQSRSTPQRIGLCRKASSSKKRISEILFIDKWYEPGEKQNRA